jgi:AhpC/TSA family
LSFEIGQAAPQFTLPDTAGAMHSVPQDAPATVVVWTCNHCPYALAWHPRVVAVARDYADRGVRFLCINSNDAVRYPDDSAAAMAERVAGEPGEWPMPYLHDESQEVAREWDAKTTPDVYVLDASGNLAYRGAPDADWEDESLDARWLRGALDAVLDGDGPDPAETEPVGCSIKWRE